MTAQAAAPSVEPGQGVGDSVSALGALPANNLVHLPRDSQVGLSNQGTVEIEDM